MKKLILLGTLIILLNGCATTALYGEKFENVSKNIYTLQIAFGGPPTLSEKDIETETRKVLGEEADKFISNNSQYSSYKILNYERKSFPRAILYKVEFE